MQKKNYILIILLIIAILLLAYIAFKPKAVIAPIGEQTNKETIKESTPEVKEQELSKYENKELGFTFDYPSNLGELTFFGVGKGEKGETFGGGINFPQFYFAGNSRGYIAPEDGNFGRAGIENCGTVLSKSTNEEVKASSRKTTDGQEYAFNIFSPVEGKQGFWGFERGVAAYFTLKSENKRFPCLGFSSVGENVLSDEEFLKIIDSVKIK
ncbi:MAG: hypothetical protein AAB477_01625 [Patescibacteria group bacterium]